MTSGGVVFPHFFYSSDDPLAVVGVRDAARPTNVSEELEQALERELESLGFELVDLERAGHRARPVLRLRIDRPESAPGEGVTVDDCARASRALEPLLDARDDLPATYVLEVSSPGVERPIRKRRDFERFVGREIRVRGYAPLIEGSRKLRGTLLGIEGQAPAETVRLRLEEDEREIELPRSAIAKAQLVYDWKKEQKG